MQVKPAECPVCYDSDVQEWRSPLTSLPTECIHWLCASCWESVAARNTRCPVCRADLALWHESSGLALTRVSDDEEEEEEEEEEEGEDSEEVMDYCEVCDRDFPVDESTVLWLNSSLLHCGRRIYSVCEDCDDELGENMKTRGGHAKNGEAFSFCEMCFLHYFSKNLTVTWFRQPFKYAGKNVYSCCDNCRENPGMEDILDAHGD